MSSKQMAFQFTQLQFREQMRATLESYEEGQRNHKNPREWLDSITTGEPDKKKRQKLTVIWGVITRCWDKNRDVMRVKKIVVWRGSDGEPGEVQIEWER